jgi:hypothetical protein
MDPRLEIFIKRMKVERERAELALLERKLAIEKAAMGKELDPAQLPPVAARIQTRQILVYVWRAAPLSAS